VAERRLISETGAVRPVCLARRKVPRIRGIKTGWAKRRLETKWVEGTWRKRKRKKLTKARAKRRRMGEGLVFQIIRGAKRRGRDQMRYSETRL